MTTNPHLDMANDVFNRMFGLPIIAPPEPIEAEHGICAVTPDEETEQVNLRG